MKTKILICFVLCYNFVFSQNTQEAAAGDEDTRISIYTYDYKLTDIEGKAIDFNKFKGKKLMLVNTASKDGGTPQLLALQQMHKKYGKKLVIIGFPSDDFGKEPNTNPQIRKFYEQNYGVDFVIIGKTYCKGEKANPIYKYIASKDLNGSSSYDISTNFQKILINADGKIDAVHPSKKNLNSQDILSWIEE